MINKRCSITLLLKLFIGLIVLLGYNTIAAKAHAGHFGEQTGNRLPGTTNAGYLNNLDSSYLKYKNRAKRLFDLIMSHYAIPGTNFLAENYPRQQGDKKVAYMWSFSGMVTAAGVLRQLGLSDTNFVKVGNGIDEYWSYKYGLWGVASYPPVYGGGKRFYDDNATIGLDYLENYKATGRRHFLNQAERCINFDFTGESMDCGGGLFWNEEEKNPEDSNYIKATCSSAFATTLALQLYMITKKDKYLAFGKRLYSWLKSNLQDPVDLTYWNDVAIEGCVPNKTKWSYNSGAMISNAVLLYRITGDKRYFNDAKKLVVASFDYFTVPSTEIGFLFPDHAPWFNVVLFRGFFDFYRIDPDKNMKYINAVIKFVNYAWKNARTENGFFYEDWSGKKKGYYTWLLNQACMVEICGRIALFYQEQQKVKKSKK